MSVPRGFRPHPFPLIRSPAKVDSRPSGWRIVLRSDSDPTNDVTYAAEGIAPTSLPALPRDAGGRRRAPRTA
jgi:hypothetical protein